MSDPAAPRTAAGRHLLLDIIDVLDSFSIPKLTNESGFWTERILAIEAEAAAGSGSLTDKAAVEDRLHNDATARYFYELGRGAGRGSLGVLREKAADPRYSDEWIGNAFRAALAVERVLDEEAAR